MGIKIVGLGKYVPPFNVTNEMLSRIVDTDNEWIKTRTGIETRHACEHDTTYSMGAKASTNAIENAKIAPTDIDMVICTTVTPDFYTPSTACIIADLAGATNAVCFDINVACSAFVYALDIAEKYLQSDEYKNILVVGSEMVTKITDYADRASCILFGDGAGACVVQKSDNLFKAFMGSDVTGCNKLFARTQPRHAPFIEDDGYVDPHFPEGNSIGTLWQDGKEVYKFATKAMPLAIEKAVEKANIALDDLKYVFPHQANIRIIETAAKNLNLDINKFYINIEKHGNMSSACIPIALCEAREQGLINDKDKLCLVGFGAGLTYGACVVEW